MTEIFNGLYKVRYLQPEECLHRFLFDDDDYPGKVNPEQGVIYVEADKASIAYLCPCNGTHEDGDCLKYVQTIPIDGSRGWSFRDDAGVPTISPSIFRKPPNGCHYFIEGGLVRWV